MQTFDELISSLQDSGVLEETYTQDGDFYLSKDVIRFDDNPHTIAFSSATWGTENFVHRLNGPAWLASTGVMYYQYNQMHNEDGPALVDYNKPKGSDVYFLYGHMVKGLSYIRIIKRVEKFNIPIASSFLYEFSASYKEPWNADYDTTLPVEWQAKLFETEMPALWKVQAWMKAKEEYEELVEDFRSKN